MRNLRSGTQARDSGSALARDFENVVTDTQELLRTIGNEGDAKLAEATRQGRRSLEETVKHLEALRTNVATGAKTAAKSADRYVRENPWGAVGIAAALGAFTGLLLARRKSRV